jgi:hypothetical protein
VDDWRIIYTIEPPDVVLVVKIGHRKQIYEPCGPGGAAQFALHDGKRNADVADVALLRKDGVTPQPKRQGAVHSCA